MQCDQAAIPFVELRCKPLFATDSHKVRSWRLYCHPLHSQAHLRVKLPDTNQVNRLDTAPQQRAQEAADYSRHNACMLLARRVPAQSCIQSIRLAYDKRRGCRASSPCPTFILPYGPSTTPTSPPPMLDALSQILHS